MGLEKFFSNTLYDDLLNYPCKVCHIIYDLFIELYDLFGNTR